LLSDTRGDREKGEEGKETTGRGAGKEMILVGGDVRVKGKKGRGRRQGSGANLVTERPCQEDARGDATSKKGQEDGTREREGSVGCRKEDRQ